MTLAFLRLGQLTFFPATSVTDLNTLETSGDLSQAACPEHRGQGIPADPHPHDRVPLYGLVG